MRVLSSSLAAVLTAVHASGAFYLYTQERWVRSPSEAQSASLADVQNLEAIMGIASERLGRYRGTFVLVGLAE